MVLHAHFLSRRDTDGLGGRLPSGQIVSRYGTSLP